MSKNTLEAYVKEYKNGSLEPKTDVPRNISMELSEQTLNQLKKIKGEKSWEELMQEFLQLREQEKPEPVVTEKRYIPTQIRQFVYHRTNGKCAFSTCTKKGVIHHHTERFAETGKHDPEKIVLLCKSHHNLCHQSLVDEQNWEILKYPKNNWVDQKVRAFQRK
jgi:hypothetical protein